MEIKLAPKASLLIAMSIVELEAQSQSAGRVTHIADRTRGRWNATRHVSANYRYLTFWLGLFRLAPGSNVGAA